jgi:molecular chaperone GrpE (heat shock protein)
LLGKFGKTEAGQSNDLNLLEEGEELSSLEDKVLRLRASLRKQVFQLLKEVCDRLVQIASKAGELDSSLNTVSGQQEKIEERISKLESLIKGLLQESSEISTKMEVTDRNLSQVRLLAERLADKIDNLSQEFIDRWVREPLLKDVISIHNAIKERDNEDGIGSAEVLEQLRLTLESHAAKLIEPQRGAPFNPREHQPIKKIETPTPSLDRCVYQTYKVGFSFNGRIVQRALVGLFFLKEGSGSSQSKEVKDESANKE